MSKLIMSEWERLWKRKVTWLMVAALPIMAYCSSKILPKAKQLDYTRSSTIRGFRELPSTWTFRDANDSF